ncbi:phage major capsid protein [Rhodococcus sp. MS16]|uniref:phage major capsid protein n=1 Tax=Rhodococcus sp. MS16 TaxID=2579941 RepID=UPI001F5BAC72|nr:phage major capsid protein [Rhodococcus sp. MS16]
MSMFTANSGAILTPAQIDELLVKPVMAMSVALQVARIVPCESSSLRLPVVNEDPSAGWYAEGTEIGVTDMVVDQVNVAFHKLAGLSVVSNELIADSSPEASALVGEGLARDIARKLDDAFFRDGATVANSPAGLGVQSGVAAVDAGAAFTNLDPFEAAISKVETVGANVTAFVVNPTTALSLAVLKTATGSNSNLLSVDPTMPTRRMISGVPLYVSPSVADGTVWGIAGDRAVIGMRKDVAVESDTSAFFTSDRTAIRGIMRVGLGFPHTAAIAKITLSAP